MIRILTTIVTLVVAISAGASTGSDPAPCLPDGESADVCGSAKLTGRQSMYAEAKEEDPLFDDHLGEPTISSTGKGVYKACVTITNSGGDLYGPNNEIQNTGTEGDCIEVYLIIHVVSPVSGSVTGPGGTGGSISFGMGGSSNTSPTSICPC